MAFPTVRLGDVCTKIGSGATPRGGSAAYQSAGIPLIRSMNVRMFSFDEDGLAFLNEAQAAGLDNVRVQPGDVLLNITGASIGRVCVAPPEMDGARVNQHVSIIRTNGVLDSRFLMYYLGSPEQQAFITSDASGMTRPGFTKGKLEEYEVPCPTLNEQRRIVSRIEELRGHSGKAAVALRRAESDSRLLRQALLDRAYGIVLQHSLRLIPFGDVLSDIRGGTTLVPTDEPNEISVLRSSAVRPGEIDWQDVRYIKDPADLSPHHMVADGDLLITRLSGSLDYVGNMAVARNLEGRHVAYPDRLFRARLKPGHLPEFYPYLFASRPVRTQLEPAAKSTAGHQRISISDVQKAVVPLCEPTTQATIVTQLQVEMADLRRFEAFVTGETQSPTVLMQQILAEAFSS